MSTWRAAFRRSALAVAIGLAAGALLCACAGGTTGTKSNDAAAAGAPSDPTATSDPSPTAVAEPTLAVEAAHTLPVTPVNIQYTVNDPKFDALPWARAIYGTYEGGGYQIEVPDAWNGDVVYFAHGFRGNPPQLTIDAPPLREWFIRNGYAWAASSYSKNGYEPGAGARDTYALRDVFAQKVGAPKHNYLYGQSMGGHVVTLSLEQYPTAYDGALSECGVVSGHEVLDYFLSWGALAGYFTKTPLFDAATDASLLSQRFSTQVLPGLGTDTQPTPAGKAFADVIERMTGGPRPFFREGYAKNFGFNFVVLLNAVASAGPSNAAADNSRTAYSIDEGFGVDSATLNRDIERAASAPLYRDPVTYPEFAPMTGKIQRPLLTLHDTGDLFVPISLEQSYRRTVDAAGSGDLLVQRAIRRAGHCAFSPEERVQGFQDLVAWVEQGQKPGGDDLLGDLSDIGRTYTTPLERNDPGALTPSP